jgi:SHS2 domain-containing protein
MLASTSTTATATDEPMPMVSLTEGKVVVTEQKKQDSTMQSLFHGKWEYLDHTADIQLHSWGDTLSEALEGQLLAMMDYMTPLHLVEINPAQTVTLEAKGHNLLSLIYHFMDEWLYKFSTDEFIVKACEIVALDKVNWTITAVGYGETMDLTKHEQGTEVKAITFSAMQVKETPDKTDVYVVVDI